MAPAVDRRTERSPKGPIRKRHSSACLFAPDNPRPRPTRTVEELGCRLSESHRRNALMRGCASWIVGIVAFFVTAWGIGSLLGPETCRDGWPSSSIGHRGACSWHGGVDHSRDILVFIYLAGGALAGFRFYGSKLGRSLDNEPSNSARPQPPLPPPPSPVHPVRPAPKPFVPPREGETPCPKCGSAMRLRKARRGRHRGKSFWGCMRYPTCDGTAEVA